VNTAPHTSARAPRERVEWFECLALGVKRRGDTATPSQDHVHHDGTASALWAMGVTDDNTTGPYNMLFFQGMFRAPNNWRSTLAANTRGAASLATRAHARVIRSPR
jgi:hypothetical protein